MNRADKTPHHLWQNAALPTQLAPAGFLLVTSSVSAQQLRSAGSAEATTADEPVPDRLPQLSITMHQLDIRGRAMAFTATAGAVTSQRSDGAPEADIAYVAYTAKSDRDARRPVTFVVNGGPGAASAYFQLGALGPWRLLMGGSGFHRHRTSH